MGRHCKVECRECGKHLRMRHTCETCGKSIRSDNIPRHKRTCQKNKENEGDAVSVNENLTMAKSETRLVDHSSVSSGRVKERICQKCNKSYAHRQSLYRHKKYCKKNKENEGDAVGVSDSRATETRPKKRKADCLQEAEFEEAEFSGVKPLSEETLLRMMEMMKMAYENRARIIKLEKRFYQRTVILE